MTKKSKKSKPNSFELMIKCGKEKCSKSKNANSCMEKHCSKILKKFNNNSKKFIKDNNKKRKENIKEGKECVQKHCSKHKTNLSKKKCIKKKCSKELKRLVL